MSMADLLLDRHNPDVLTCIANLSNDEVFTPPEMAGAMLDLVAEAWAKDHDGANLWANPNVRVLDPVVKTGVFLREATRRFNEGLASVIPDPQERVNHILTQQIYGIAITELTALMARRSVYCSRYANSSHSICTAFDTPEGNIWFERTEHSWDDKTGKREIRVHPLTGEELFIRTGRKCSYCGAGESDYERGDDKETHAYAFIHTSDIKKRISDIFGAVMHFDLIVGNPPYQLSDGGFGKSAVPIYHSFVEQAKALDPTYLSMIIPARWFAGGKGLDNFRQSMLHSPELAELHDFPNTEDVFPGVNVRGGICYFLYNKNHIGETKVVTHQSGFEDSVATRPLLEPACDTFIRYNTGVTILRKVRAVEGAENSNYRPFSELVSSRKPFGIPTNEKGQRNQFPGSLILYTNSGMAFYPADRIQDKYSLASKIKLFVPYASPGSDTYPHLVLSKPIVAGRGEIATETYLAIGPFDSESEAMNVATYMGTKFFRFMLSLLRVSQHVTRSVYSFVPLLDFSIQWDDDLLAERYGLSIEERQFIDRFVKEVAWKDSFK